MRAVEVSGSGSEVGSVLGPHIRNRPLRWRMRNGRSGWYGFMLPSGISIRTRLACSGFRQVAIWRQR